jgi:NADH-quinone oxidoreductase subunit A
MTPTTIAGYLLLFAGVAAGFVFVALVIGKLLRPHRPSQAKLATYECGEPAVGSSYIQFDLRFYVVALVFIIFEVEIAFFFPWAVVFGKLTHLRQPALEASASAPIYQQLGVPQEQISSEPVDGLEADSGRLSERQLSALALAAIVDLAVFFGVLLVGFAYAWHKGDLDWVRAIGPPQ